MKNSITLFVLLCLVFSGYTQAQITSLNWSFKTNSRILATPTHDEGSIYIGSEKGAFYSMNASDGTLNWQFTTRKTIKGQALITDDVVFFESGNVFYALNKNSGKQLWIFDTKDTLFHDQIDIYDDQRSNATAYNNIIYVGTSGGFLYGLDKKSGNVKLKLATEQNAPIRSSPLIKDEKLYFGDWSGIVYCYDLNASKFVWKKKSYDFPKPYVTFGGIASGYASFGDRLYFGARNHIFNVLNTATGERAWSYTSPEGGWMFGTPVLYDSVIYIGGSDNHSMHAFTPVGGRLTWKYNSGQNIMGKPLVTEKYVIFTTGNLYKLDEPGALIRLDRETGGLVSKLLIPNPSISSPVLIGNESVVFGCYDGYLYSVKLFDI